MPDPSSDTNARTSPRNTTIRWRRREWLRWVELTTRVVLFFICNIVLVLCIAVSVMIHHELGISYAAAACGILVNGIELVRLYFAPPNKDVSCCLGIVDCLLLPLYAFGSLGAFIDGTDISGNRGFTVYTGPLPVPIGILLAVAAGIHFMLSFVDCVHCCTCCCKAKRRRRNERRNIEDMAIYMEQRERNGTRPPSYRTV
ncbi:hypothetical protein B0J14DRAFT_659870 [Halenospora varia]|nr:hypothetical protein B0J14DRAFT_659870 [Halenospora varia]